MNKLWDIMVSAVEMARASNVNRMKIMNTFFQHRPSHKYTCYGWNNEKQKYDRENIDRSIFDYKSSLRNQY